MADINDKVYRTEKSFSLANNTNITPSLVLYYTEGKETLRLSGYHPPYQFVAALEFVADSHYKKDTLKNYLARAASFSEYGNDELNANDIFSPPPYGLDRTLFPPQMPAAVFF